MTGDFTDLVRQAARELGAGGNPTTTAGLSEWLRLHTNEDFDTRKLWQTVQDLRRRGELVASPQAGRQRGKSWFFTGRGGGSLSPRKAEIMWRVIRARRLVTLADLQEMAGVSLDYAREFVRRLVRLGVLLKAGAGWRLIHDPVEVPRDGDKAEYLRRWREQKKQARAAIEEAEAALARARAALEE